MRVDEITQGVMTVRRGPRFELYNISTCSGWGEQEQTARKWEMMAFIDNNA